MIINLHENIINKPIEEEREGFVNAKGECCKGECYGPLGEASKD